MAGARINGAEQPPSAAERARYAQSPATDKPVPAWADTLTRLLDDWVTVPGTRFGIGLDAVLGFLLPGVGDLVTGTGSLALVILALQSGVPRVVMLRMLVNLAVDALIGSIPILGDVFDVAWKANRKNLELLRRHQSGADRRPIQRIGDYAVVLLAALIVACAVALPVVLIALFIGWLGE